MACHLSASSHYLNQCWNIVSWTLGNKLQWNLNQNSQKFVQENAFENGVWKMAAILSWPQWVDKRPQSSPSWGVMDSFLWVFWKRLTELHIQGGLIAYSSIPTNIKSSRHSFFTKLQIVMIPTCLFKSNSTWNIFQKNHWCNMAWVNILHYFDIITSITSWFITCKNK